MRFSSLSLLALVSLAACESVEVAPVVGVGSRTEPVSVNGPANGPIPQAPQTETVRRPAANIGLQIRIKPGAGKIAAPEDQMRDVILPEYADHHVVFTVAGDAAVVVDVVRDAGLGAFETARLQSLDMTLVTAVIPEGTTPPEATLQLQSDPRVILAGPNHLYQVMGKLKRLPKQFELAGYDVKAAVPLVSGRIALIDTPVDLKHAELAKASLTETILRPKAKPAAHGTAIASLLVGGDSVPGAAPGAEILSFAAFAQVNADTPPIGETRHIALALDKAILAQVDVMNLSFGGPQDKILSALLDEAEKRGICVAAAAGNGGAKGKAPFPANAATTLAVTAVDSKKKIYAFATPGAHVDLAAFGVDVMAAAPDGYKLTSGTSFSTAILSAELLRSGHCGAGKSPTSARESLAAKSEDLGAKGRDDTFGVGLFKR